MDAFTTMTKRQGCRLCAEGAYVAVSKMRSITGAGTGRGLKRRMERRVRRKSCKSMFVKVIHSDRKVHVLSPVSSNW